MTRYTISENAEIIWHILCQNNEEVSINELRESSGLDIRDIYIAIGWLARENKIIFEKSDEVDSYYKSQNFYF